MDVNENNLREYEYEWNDLLWGRLVGFCADGDGPLITTATDILNIWVAIYCYENPCF